MGRHFSKVRGHGHIGPLKKVRGPRPPGPPVPTPMCSYKHLLIMGDFNFPEISYKDNLVSAGPAAATSRFYNMTQDEFITQYVLEPTRMRKAT